MDPLSGFLSIVGLLANFSAERGKADVIEIREFLEWLVKHGHEDLRLAIEKDHATGVSIKALLAEGTEDLRGRLARLDEKITAVAAGLGPMDDLARTLHPNAVLSEQARAILCEFELTQATQALEHSSMDRGGYELLFMDAKKNGELEITEQRFYHDDINQLLAYGLLLLSHNTRGEKLFRMSRLGSSVAQQLLLARGQSS